MTITIDECWKSGRKRGKINRSQHQRHFWPRKRHPNDQAIPIPSLPANPFPFDDQDTEGTGSTQRQVPRDKLRRTLAAGDMVGSSLLLQLAMLQTLERIGDRLVVIAAKVEEEEIA